MKQFWIFFLCVCPALLTCRFAFAFPQVDVSYQYYDIQGNKAPALLREMHHKGFRGAKGKTFDAHTDWTVKWDYKYREEGLHCKVDPLNVKVSIVYILPRWNDRRGASANLSQKWETFYAALQLHEKGHADHGIQAGEEVEALLIHLGKETACKDFNRKATEQGKAVIQQYAQKDEDYDTATQHGILQGAKFP